MEFCCLQLLTGILVCYRTAHDIQCATSLFEHRRTGARARKASNSFQPPFECRQFGAQARKAYTFHSPMSEHRWMEAEAQTTMSLTPPQKYVTSKNECHHKLAIAMICKSHSALLLSKMKVDNLIQLFSNPIRCFITAVCYFMQFLSIVRMTPISLWIALGLYSFIGKAQAVSPYIQRSYYSPSIISDNMLPRIDEVHTKKILIGITPFQASSGIMCGGLVHMTHCL
jgi:hypothetical protein